MGQIVEFLMNHWQLALSFVILLVLLVMTEAKKAGRVVDNNLLTQLVNREKAVLVDIRDRENFTKGHIANSLHMPYDKFSTSISGLEKHKDVPIIVICKTGHTARAAVQMLHAQGFVNVCRLHMGISGWVNARLPLVK